MILWVGVGGGHKESPPQTKKLNHLGHNNYQPVLIAWYGGLFADRGLSFADWGAKYRLRIDMGGGWVSQPTPPLWQQTMTSNHSSDYSTWTVLYIILTCLSFSVLIKGLMSSTGRGFLSINAKAAEILNLHACSIFSISSDWCKKMTEKYRKT